MSDLAIRVENLGKRYRIGGRQGPYKRFTETVMDTVSAPIRRLRNLGKPTPPEETIWALKDVSFEVRRGEVVGIIGRNGAGKTTLLKILSRITEPTEGRAEIHGRVGSLLEVGTGFHPELTGRENIYLNGAILGMKRAEIERKFDEIVDFAEIEKFMDTPVKRYSSGMYVRLAFAVAAHLEPEILLVDEVLAVGDIAFQKKCLGKMGDVAKGGRTVLFVSHNMQAVRTLCPRSLLLEGGNIVVNAPTADVQGAYYDLLRQLQVDANTGVMNSANRRGSGAVRFTDIRVEDESGETHPKYTMGSTIRFVLSYQAFAPVEDLFISVVLRAGRFRGAVTSVKYMVSGERLYSGHTGSVVLEFPNVNLRPGEYPLYFWLGNRMGRPYDVVDDLTTPLIIHTDKGFQELGYDPSQAAGFFNIESRIVQLQP